MERIVTLTVLQTLIKTLVQNKVLSEDDEKRIWLDSIEALQEARLDHPDDEQATAQAVKYLEHVYLLSSQ